MHLKAYCADRGQKAELARRLGIAASTLSRICSSKPDDGRKASIKLALRIEMATDGVVQAHEVPMTEASRLALEALRSRPEAARAVG